MHPDIPIQPIDYLVIGHLTIDLTSQGPKLGGTAAYASLTATAMGLRVGILTSMGPEAMVGNLKGIQILSLPSEKCTTFENLSSSTGRIQYIHSVASELDFALVPDLWRNTSIVHLGPVAQEVPPNLVRYFPDSFIGLTPQGWLRDWDTDGRIYPGEWPEASFVLEKCSAAVLSIDDLEGDEERVDEMVSSARCLVVTEGIKGARVYWNGELQYFKPPKVDEIDPIGAGDIFATAFFIELNSTKNPWEAARFATYLAATSVTRSGLQGVPTPQEIEAYTAELINE